MLDVTPTEDGTMLKICLTEHGITSCCYTSSMHLVEDHRKQLERANNRKAAACYAEISQLEQEAMMPSMSFLEPLHDA
jgi:hypothetical protein